MKSIWHIPLNNFIKIMLKNKSRILIKYYINSFTIVLNTINSYINLPFFNLSNIRFIHAQKDSFR